MPVSLEQILKTMVEQGATDLHLMAEAPPQMRIGGELVQMQSLPLAAADTKALIHSVMSDRQKRRLEDDLELDFSFGVEGLPRFRAHVFSERGAAAAVLRPIPLVVRSFQELGLPPVVAALAEAPRGLVLVTGPPGSGKSTTLAAMIDKINRERLVRIVTIEDPIEYVHSHRRGVVNQREIGSDTRSFPAALRSVLREDPNVVMIGEMRDPETVEGALRVAETGHLALASLHSNSAAQTISRVIDMFPSHQQQQVRAQLSSTLEGIICQSLLPHMDGKGRVLGLEILVPNTAIRNLIREDKIHQIYSMMQTGQAKFGMQTFNQSLAALYTQGRLTLEAALDASHYPDELRAITGRGGGPTKASIPSTPAGDR